MHIANIKVPSEWTKLVDLIHIGRDKFEVKAGETYYIHNNSDFILYAVESEGVPTDDVEAKRVYAGKSAGYVKVAGDLYVCSKLPAMYPYPPTISMIFCDDVVANDAVVIGAYVPETNVKGAYVFKGSVANEDALPKTGMVVGDVYDIKATGMNVAWTGEAWDALGATVSVDLTPYAKKADVDAEIKEIKAELPLKATKEELTEKLATKAEAADVVALEAKIEDKADKTAIPDVSGFATKEELKEGLDAKENVDDHIVKYLDFGEGRRTIQLANHNTISGIATDGTGHNLAMLSKWDVADFGAAGVHCNLNTKDNVTINDKDVIATEAALKVIADKVDLKASLADIDGLLFRVGRMEDKVAALEKTNTEPVAAESSDTLNLTDTAKDYVVSGDIAKAAAISGKTVTLKDVTVNGATLALNAEKDVELKSVNLTGTYPSNKGKVIKNDNAEYVTIKDSTFDASAAYNMVEIGLDGTTLPKGVLIENCKFTGNYANNAILVFGTQDNAVININNCYFEHVSNVLRLSNKTNAKNVTVNITNCKCDHWDTDPQWAGLLICQDYTSGNAVKANENNLFAPDKITINISNLTIPDGTLLEAPKDMATIAGSFDDKQVFYLWDNYRNGVAYDAAKYPAINIL